LATTWGMTWGRISRLTPQSIYQKQAEFDAASPLAALAQEGNGTTIGTAPPRGLEESRWR